MSIADGLAAAAELSDLKKTISEMGRTMKNQQESIRLLEEQLQQSVTMSQLRAALLTKADTGEISQSAQALGSKVGLEQFNEQESKMQQALSKKVDTRQFKEQETKIQQLHGTMEHAAHEIFDRYAQKMESTLSAKANVEAMDAALRAKADASVVREISHLVQRVTRQADDLTKQQKQLPVRLVEIVVEKLGPRMAQLHLSHKQATVKAEAGAEQTRQFRRELSNFQEQLEKEKAARNEVEIQHAAILVQFQKLQKQMTLTKESQQTLCDDLNQIHASVNASNGHFEDHKALAGAIRQESENQQKKIEGLLEQAVAERENVQRQLGSRIMAIASKCETLLQGRGALEKQLQRLEGGHRRLDDHRLRQQQAMDELRQPILNEVLNLKEENRLLLQELRRQQEVHRRTCAQFSTLGHTNPNDGLPGANTRQISSGKSFGKGRSSPRPTKSKHQQSPRPSTVPHMPTMMPPARSNNQSKNETLYGARTEWQQQDEKDPDEVYQYDIRPQSHPNPSRYSHPHRNQRAQTTKPSSLLACAPLESEWQCV